MIVYWTTEEKLEKIEIRKWTIDERNVMTIQRKIQMIGEDNEKKIGSQVIKKVVKKKKNLVRDENATVEGKEIGAENETVEGITEKGLETETHQRGAAGMKDPKKGLEVEIEREESDERVVIENGKEKKAQLGKDLGLEKSIEVVPKIENEVDPEIAAAAPGIAPETKPKKSVQAEIARKIRTNID